MPSENIVHELNRLYAYAPGDFEFLPSKLVWQDPCWLSTDIILRPKTAETIRLFFANLRLPHSIDAFSKIPWEKQLSSESCAYFRFQECPHAIDWFRELMRHQRDVANLLLRTNSIFDPPFSFVHRRDFILADLASILQEKPEHLNIYLAFEKRRNENYVALRIHSRPPFVGPNPRCLWFEKRLPRFVAREDIMVWFLAMIESMPKKYKPTDLLPWKNRFLDFEPDLVPFHTPVPQSWNEKSKIVFVFGPTKKAGLRFLDHIERRDVSHIIRRENIITLVGVVRHNYADGTQLEFEHTFHLLTHDDIAAQRVERQLLSGDRIYFGLDVEIQGMIIHTAHVINAINVPCEIIRKLCLTPGLDIELASNPREKRKQYYIIEAAKHSI